METGFNVTAGHLRPVPGDDGQTDRSWEPDDPGYSADNFYTVSADSKGHSAFFRVALPTNVAAEINRLIASGNLPVYATSQDLIRDAIYHRLHWLGDRLLDPRLRHSMGVQQRLADRRQQVDEVRALEDLVDESRMALEKAVELQDLHLLNEVLTSLEEEVETGIRDPYKGQLMGLIAKYCRWENGWE